MDIETASATPLSPVSVRLALRGHVLVQDKPPSSGGHDEGPMASELLLAGLLACQHSTFVKVAAKRKAAARLVRLDGAMEFKDGDIHAIRVAFEVEAPAATTDEALATLVRLTDKTCTISKALKVPVEGTLRRV